jgi:hypothetical protein
MAGDLALPLQVAKVGRTESVDRQQSRQAVRIVVLLVAADLMPLVQESTGPVVVVMQPLSSGGRDLRGISLFSFAASLLESSIEYRGLIGRLLINIDDFRTARPPERRLQVDL